MGEVRYAVEDGIALLTIDYPPVNALSRAMRADVLAALRRAGDDPAVAAIILLGAGRAFVAGADIAEFDTGGFRDAPTLEDLQRHVTASAKPTIAAIHGFALGGGLELALTCHARVADATARLGLPEVKLGILPGAGGTQRLTRLVGAERAAEWLVSGVSVSADDALAAGLVDAVVADIERGAVAFARAALDRGQAFVPVLDRPLPPGNDDPVLIARLRARVTREARGAAAPLAIVDCIEAALTRPPADALAYEKARCHALIAGEQAAAMRYGFAAERRARKVTDVEPEVRARPIRSAAVIGSGTKSGHIAMAFANAGIAAKRLVIGREALADLSDVDIAVVVSEETDLTHLAEFDAAMKHGAILALDSALLEIDAGARATKRPEDVIGVHFFLSGSGLGLQENVRGMQSSPETIATVMALGKIFGTVVVLARGGGFFGPMLQVYRDAAVLLLEHGATRDQIDRVAEAFGMATGPLAGLDRAAAAASDRRAFTDAEIEARLFMPLVDAGARALEDGSAIRAGDVDVAWVAAGGFPAHKGGPMYWGTRIGLARVRDMAVLLAAENGPRWAPSALLERRVAGGAGWDAA